MVVEGFVDVVLVDDEDGVDDELVETVVVEVLVVGGVVVVTSHSPVISPVFLLLNAKLTN